MRRKRLVVAACLAALLAGSTGAATAALPAAAQPPPTPGVSPEAEAEESEIEVPEPVPGEEVCTITDQRMQELSGLVALDDTFVTINDGGQPWEGQPIFFLDQNCQVVEEIRYPEDGSRDPEDLAYDYDADVLWVGDIGDNFETTGAEPRPSVGLWRVDLAGDRFPVLYRFAYPDGAHDAEALLLDSDGIPIIVTKTLGAAGIYRPAGDPVPNNSHEDAVPLELVGEINLPDTGSDNRFGPAGRQTVTSGAVSPDGTRVVLRTYADAFEFDVTDGDVIGAITDGTPRVTPLPGEPQGEAISYTPDGTHFLTVSETADEVGVDPAILRYLPTEPAPEPTPEEAAGTSPTEGSSRSLLDRLGWQGVLNIIAAVGVIGALMVAAGVVGIVRARRRSPDDPEEEPDGGPYGPDDDFGGAQPAGGTVARARVTPPPNGPPGPAQAPGVYAAGGHRGGEYGGPPEPPPGSDPRREGPPQGTAYRSGTVYGAGAGYQEHPFDQDNPHGYSHPGGYHPGGHEHPGGYHPGGHEHPGGHDQSGSYGHPGGYPAGHGYEGGHPGPAPHYPQPDAGGTYQSGTYQAGSYQGGSYQGGHPSAHEDVPDYYYDDPDYPYEFRDRGR